VPELAYLAAIRESYDTVADDYANLVRDLSILDSLSKAMLAAFAERRAWNPSLGERLDMGMGKAVTVALIMLLSACTKPAPAPSVSPPPEQCAATIDKLSQPPGTLEIVLGVVALPTQRMLQVHETGQPGELFAKNGLVVKADAEVELAVGEGVTGARLDWNGVATTGPATRHLPCSGQTDWFIYAGGYYVAAPACLPIVVRYGSREQTVRIAVGIAC